MNFTPVWFVQRNSTSRTSSRWFFLSKSKIAFEVLVNNKQKETILYCQSSSCSHWAFVTHKKNYILFQLIYLLFIYSLLFILRPYTTQAFKKQNTPQCIPQCTPILSLKTCFLVSVLIIKPSNDMKYQIIPRSFVSFSIGTKHF